MTHTLTRFDQGDDGTFSRWTDENGNQLCVTVEQAAIGDHPRIEAGLYTFNQFNSPTKGDVWLRDDTAANDGRTMIEIHPANWARQLLGCIAPGKDIEVIEGTKGVTDSQNTFKMLKSILPDTFQLNIVEQFT